MPALQPLHREGGGRGGDRYAVPGKLAKVIEECKTEDHRFHMEGSSWTNNISWVRGYDSLLGPMERMS